MKNIAFAPSRTGRRRSTEQAPTIQYPTPESGATTTHIGNLNTVWGELENRGTLTQGGLPLPVGDGYIGVLQEGEDLVRMVPYTDADGNDKVLVLLKCETELDGRVIPFDFAVLDPETRDVVASGEEFEFNVTTRTSKKGTRKVTELA